MSWLLRIRETFQAAHYLKDYGGKCERTHGHTFKVEVVVEVNELNPTGIGLDFAEIKKMVSEILPDHTHLNEVFPFNPSAENLARYFFEALKSKLPLREVTVWESDDAAATYTENR
ncbi:MAG: 6-carboxytetrahydropterin synthase [Candidatus Aminicenantes bacterium]|nr:6-carboxytetrahydropterin synthase [Candidatus Aminicenantes bacterium]